MANLKKARVYAEEFAEQTGLVNESDISIFSNGFVEGYKTALHDIISVANRGHINSVLQYCKIED